MIDEIFHNAKILVRNRPKIKPFGKEKSNNIIYVFVCTTLPGLMWLGEVDRSAQMRFYFPKLRKFGTVIKANTVNRQIGQQLLNHPAGFFGAAI